jgi:hypothetical protein
MLVGRNGATTAWRWLGRKRIRCIPPFPCEQPLDGGAADAEGGGDLGAGQTAARSGDDALATIERVGFHGRKDAKYSVFLLTAVGPK